MVGIAAEGNVLKLHNSLKMLDLESNRLTQVCERALTAFFQATKNDAANAAGSYAYFAAVRAIRDIFCPLGWKRGREHNLEYIAHPKNGIRVIVSSGNQDTGIQNGTPKTKNQKGKQTQKVVAHNALKQIPMFPDREPKFDDDQVKSTWMLLYHIDIMKAEMRIELSLPIELDAEGLRVAGWKERIILPPIKLDPTIEFPPNDPNNDDFEQEYVIQIERKDD